MIRLTILLGLVGLGAAACFKAEARPAPAPEEIRVADAAPSAVLINASEFRLDLTTHTAKAGTVDFVVRNDGRQEHEFVVVPVRDDRYGMPLGEIEAFAAGQTRALRAQLAPGKYTFVCLIVSDVHGQPKSHMSLGMKTDFEVTP